MTLYEQFIYELTDNEYLYFLNFVFTEKPSDNFINHIRINGILQIQEYYEYNDRLKSICTLRKQNVYNVKRSRHLASMATKHIFVAMSDMFTNSTVLMEVLGLHKSTYYHYMQNINSGHFAAEINKYKNIDARR